MPNFQGLIGTQEPFEKYVPDVGLFRFHMFIERGERTRERQVELNMLPPSGNPVTKKLYLEDNLYRKAQSELEEAMEQMVEAWIEANTLPEVHGLQESALFVEDQDE